LKYAGCGNTRKKTENTNLQAFYPDPLWDVNPLMSDPCPVWFFVEVKFKKILFRFYFCQGADMLAFISLFISRLTQKEEF